MKLYISGPMTGIPEFNAPLFKQAAIELRLQGHQVVSPVEADLSDGLDTTDFSGNLDELKAKTGHTWGALLARDVQLIADGDIEGIVCLPKWWKSKGARLEVFLGLLKGLKIFNYYRGEEPRPQTYPSTLWFINQSFE